MSEPRSFEEVRELYRPAAGPVSPLPASAQVLIVGAGPIGLTAANLLGAAGIRTVLVEQNAHSSDQPKAIMVDDEYLRLLDRLGLSEALRGHLTGPVGVHFISALGFVLARVGGGITPNGFGGRCAMGQPMFEKVLLQGAQRFESVGLHFQCRLTHLTANDSGVLATLQSEGQMQILSCAYVLACDGARSFVRKHLDIGFSGQQLDQPHLVVDLAEFPDQVPFIRFLCNPRRPVISVPAPYGGRRLEFMLLPGDDPQQLLSEQGVRDLCAQYTPYRNLNIKAVRVAVYDFSERICARLREGRVFLLGDAAHIMPPFGGQGMNAGGRDVANLCWKLTAVLQGQADARILDSYEAERREHIRQTLTATVREGRIINIRSWPLALLRDGVFAIGNLFPAFRRYFTQMRFTPKPFYQQGLVLHSATDRAGMVGRIFPRPALTAASGESVSFDKRIGLGFALIGIDVDPLVLQQACAHALWQHLQPALFALTLGTAPAPAPARAGVICARVADAGPARFMLAPASGCVVMLRPDRYVAAVAQAAHCAQVSDQLARLGLGASAQHGTPDSGSMNFR